MTLELGRIMTWRLPAFSALLMDLRQSLRTDVLTMLAVGEDSQWRRRLRYLCGLFVSLQMPEHGECPREGSSARVAGEKQCRTASPGSLKGTRRSGHTLGAVAVVAGEEAWLKSSTLLDLGCGGLSANKLGARTPTDARRSLTPGQHPESRHVFSDKTQCT
jgi:hypothetical protein